jgi:hypothetical protein
MKKIYVFFVRDVYLKIFSAAVLYYIGAIGLGVCGWNTVPIFKTLFLLGLGYLVLTALVCATYMFYMWIKHISYNKYFHRQF